MNTAFWGDVIGRITPHDAAGIDDLTGPVDPRCTHGGRVIFPQNIALPVANMPFASPDTGTIGFRITAARDDIAQVGLQLAALAMENGVEVVVFNHLDYCGLERFGFRCERIAGHTPAQKAQCEEQIRRFWNIDLIL